MYILSYPCAIGFKGGCVSEARKEVTRRMEEKMNNSMELL